MPSMAFMKSCYILYFPNLSGGYVSFAPPCMQETLDQAINDFLGSMDSPSFPSHQVLIFPLHLHAGGT